MKEVFKGDKVILMHEYGRLKELGNVYEVANITENCIVLRTTQTKIAIAAIPIDDFDQYFVKEATVAMKWTEWVPVLDHEGVIGYYRTNHRKVQFKDISGKHKGTASCHPNENDFNLSFGLSLAYNRCCEKSLLDDRKMLNKKLNDIEIKLDGVKGRISNMITSSEKVNKKESRQEAD